MGAGTMDAASKGYGMGWVEAERYARGTKQDRREVRGRLVKSRAGVTYGDGPFWQNYRRALTARAEAFGDAIREGRRPRTIRPSKLYALINRY